MGRVGDAEEIAEAVLWLLSDRASFVAGAIIAWPARGPEERGRVIAPKRVAGLHHEYVRMAA